MNKINFREKPRSARSIMALVMSVVGFILVCIAIFIGSATKFGSIIDLLGLICVLTSTGVNSRYAPEAWIRKVNLIAAIVAGIAVILHLFVAVQAFR